MASIINATTSTGLVSSADNSGSLQLATNNGTTAVTIDTSQRVGVGTTSPQRKVSIVGTDGASGQTEGNSRTSLFLDNNGANYLTIMTSTSENGGVFFSDNGNNNGGMVYETSSDALYFRANNTERMRITSGGNVLIGTTSAYGKTTIDIGTNVFTDNENQSGLTVQATSGSTRPLILVRSTTSGQDTAFRVSANRSGTQDRWTIGCHIARNSDNLSINYGTSDTGAGTEKFYFTSGGAAYNTTGTWGTISDARLKENIVDATPKLSDIEKLKVRNFNFIGDELKQIGFVAQEIEQVFPAIVETSELKDGTEQKTVKMTVLIPILVKAIQELNAKVEAQAVRIAELEGAQ
jgi:hypothetical protein